MIYRVGRLWVFYCWSCDTDRTTTTRAAARIVQQAHRHPCVLIL